MGLVLMELHKLLVIFVGSKGCCEIKNIKRNGIKILIIIFSSSSIHALNIHTVDVRWLSQYNK